MPKIRTFLPTLLLLTLLVVPVVRASTEAAAAAETAAEPAALDIKEIRLDNGLRILVHSTGEILGACKGYDRRSLAIVCHRASNEHLQCVQYLHAAGRG